MSDDHIHISNNILKSNLPVATENIVRDIKKNNEFLRNNYLHHLYTLKQERLRQERQFRERERDFRRNLRRNFRQRQLNLKNQLSNTINKLKNREHELKQQYKNLRLQVTNNTNLIENLNE